MRIRWNWGTAVALVYSVFAIATVAFVLFALANPVALVRDDYYQQALAHDRRMEAETNAGALGESIRVSLDRADRPAGASRADAVLELPRDHAATANGIITWYRASDASADRAVKLELDRDGVQRLPLGGLATGLWTMKVDWTANGKPFYFERAVEIRP